MVYLSEIEVIDIDHDLVLNQVFLHMDKLVLIDYLFLDLWDHIVYEVVNFIEAFLRDNVSVV